MNATVRYIVCVLLAVIVTLSAFYLMHRLISGGDGEREELEPPPGIRFGEVDLTDEVERVDRRQPDPPDPPDEPPPPPDMDIEQMEETPRERPQLDMPDLDLSMAGSGPFMGSYGQQERTGDGDVVPLVRIQPQYPREAAVAQIEGYVTIRFTITETGSVRNPQVIESRPARVFDRAAIRAILRWRFQPRVVDGVAVEREATTTIDFDLDQA